MLLNKEIRVSIILANTNKINIFSIKTLKHLLHY